MVPVFKDVGERSTAKNYFSLLSVVSKVFEKLVNNRIVDHLEKCGLSSDFQYGFRSSRSTAALLTVVSDRIARAYFNRSDIQDTVDWGKKWLDDLNAGKTQLVSLDRSNNNGFIDVKVDGSVLDEKSSFKMLGLTFSS